MSFIGEFKTDKRLFLKLLAGGFLLQSTRGLAFSPLGHLDGAPSGLFDETLRVELQGQLAQPSDQVILEIPLIAEDGAVVPVTMKSQLPKTSRLLLFAEKNPGPLLAAFKFNPDMEPFVSIRVKLNASGPVIAIAESNGHFYSASKEVTVRVGGCG
ncbi:MAG: thiosulfate oxidation carrier protein SoxY [Gammaproteobacteria bacterium]|nr:thiosulfate oxidation carrier protein SoxY [Gammaproteobacteria bacterium]NBT44029.1 thiosulfate oxidation carrier protein SoxY [Gammaproteobacteria bacterium]NBY21493.1 thiosulfate oxidation carrier protein SoxY [Gammaproteobacteria bacterium]